MDTDDNMPKMEVWRDVQMNNEAMLFVFMVKVVNCNSVEMQLLLDSGEEKDMESFRRFKWRVNSRKSDRIMYEHITL